MSEIQGLRNIHIGVDPGISESTGTGYAVLEDLGEDDKPNPSGVVVDAGCFTTPRGLSVVERVDILVSDLGLLVATYGVGARSVTIEHPATATAYRGFSGRSVASLPNYGVIVGALTWGVVIPDGCDRLTPSPNEWTRHLDAPSSRDDPHKTRRVSYLESVYGIRIGAPMTKAGGMADAIFLAMFGMFKTRHEPRKNPRDGSAASRGRTE